MARPLDPYRSKRDFTQSPEPSGGGASKKASAHHFVVQRHRARREHFDLRLEVGGVLKSWAVTRGPSANPSSRRLAVETEDHPLDYAAFEGVIPEKSYGAGAVMVWDRGRWLGATDTQARKALASGHFKFTLAGERMRGRWALVRMGAEGKRVNWLLVKDRDGFAESDDTLATRFDTSVVTGRGFEEISAGKPSRRPKPRKRGSSGAAPDFIPPMLCSAAKAPPSTGQWLYEMKYDGYRMQIAAGGGGAVIRTRNGHDWTEKFPDIAEAASRLPVRDAVIDGEAVVLDAKGLADFPALVATLQGDRAHALTFVAFDILRLDGQSLLSHPLSERKKTLARVLAGLLPGEALRLAPSLETDGQKLLGEIAAAGGEGVIAKRAGSTYVSRRSKNWLKIKARAREDAVVIGLAPSTRGRAFASLVTAVRDGGRLRYAGRVGTGFSARGQKSIMERLEPFRRASPPPRIEGLERAPPGTQWLEPRETAAIRFNGWTGDGLMRAARFLGWRDDGEEKPPVMKEKKPAAATARMAKNGSTKSAAPPITHADRVIFPRDGVTKGDVAAYYERMAPLIMPHLSERPVSVLRAPDGIDSETFFQRHPMPAMRAGLARVADPQGAHRDYMAIADPAGLATVVQFGGVELHGWGARLPDLGRPDRMVFDLDPAEGVPFERVVEAAYLIRDVLTSAGLVCFALSSGGKGIHVLAPLDRSQSWEQIEAFTSGVARNLARLEPGSFVATASKAKRKGRIFIDWLRNKSSATAIVPYSLRARAGATIACPVSWPGLKSLDGPGSFQARTFEPPRRDPWSGFFETRQNISAAALAIARRPA